MQLKLYSEYSNQTALWIFNDSDWKIPKTHVMFSAEAEQRNLLLYK